MARQMIELLPEDGATIVVMTHDRGRLLKEGIRELRSSALARKCKMVSVSGFGDLGKLMGVRGPIFIDPTAALHFKPDLYQKLETVVSGIRLHPERGTYEPS